MDCLVNPLQEKLEDWKKTLINLDKDHSRGMLFMIFILIFLIKFVDYFFGYILEYKRARSELKKRSTDTLRLQKKARKGKGGDLQRRVETCMQVRIFKLFYKNIHQKIIIKFQWNNNFCRM